jgi:hypothetical protein
MDLKKTYCGSVEWIQLAQDRDREFWCHWVSCRSRLSYLCSGYRR